VSPFRKALAALIGGVPSWGVVAQVDGIDRVELWGLVGVVATALLVWIVPNEPSTVPVADRLLGDLPPADDVPTTGAPEEP
jgi:hypothetical protein